MRKTIQQRKESGFTIIEVLIVLAIAGLIMLIVFLAVPALQRNSRNNARNQEASRVSAAITECLANRNGTTTSCDTAAEANVDITNEYQQFTTLTFGDTYPGATNYTTVNVRFGDKCQADGSAGGAAGATTRDFTVTYSREKSITRCIGSQ